jgi:PAS domain S-box-containing protein
MAETNTNANAHARTAETDEGREALAKYRVLVEHLPAIVYTSEIGTEGEWLYVSPKIEDILGWTPEEWMAHESPWTASVHPDDYQRAIDDELAAAGAGTEDNVVTIEYRMRTRDGRVLWIRDESTVVHDENGAPICLQGVMYDISDRRLAEEERDFQARLLQSISDAVIAYDLDLTVTSWNRAAQALYGWAPEEVLGRPLPEPLRRDAADAATVWDPFVDALHGWRGQVLHTDQDGYAVTIETKCVPLLDPDGSARGWVMVDREVADL